MHQKQRELIQDSITGNTSGVWSRLPHMKELHLAIESLRVGKREKDRLMSLLAYATTETIDMAVQMFGNAQSLVCPACLSPTPFLVNHHFIDCLTGKAEYYRVCIACNNALAGKKFFEPGTVPKHTLPPWDIQLKFIRDMRYRYMRPPERRWQRTQRLIEAFKRGERLFIPDKPVGYLPYAEDARRRAKKRIDPLYKEVDV